jgi:hypothetical protein
VADIGGQREHTVIANGGTLFLCAGGEVLEGEDDRFTYVYEDISAGGENRFAVLTARVTNLAGHAGIVVRQGSVVESSRSFAALTAREGRSTLFQKRAGSGMDIWGLASKDVSAPVWLQVRVDGTQVSGFISRGEQPDNWEPVWATDLPPSVPTMQIGFYVAAGGAGGAQTTLTDVTLTQSAAEGTPRLHAAAEVVPQMAGSAFSIPVPIAVCGLYTVWQESTDRGPRYTAPGWHGNVIVGTGEADTLTGSEAEDLIVALGGNDQVDAGGGSDLVCGGDGDDRVQGGDGDDRVYGGRGNDVVHGSRGNDFLVGGGGYDQVQGGDGDDTVTDRLTHEDDTVQGVEHIFPRQHRQVEELFLPLIAR